MVGLFNSAASSAGQALSNPANAQTFEALYKANLAFRRASRRPTMQPGYKTGKLAANLLGRNLASQLMPTFHEARTLREVAKRPILGMVSMLPSESQNRRRRRNSWLFASSLGGLFAAFSAVLAFVLLIGRTA